MLANRLTENPKWNVLLIEAGKVETVAQAVPILSAYMQSTAYNWGYLSEPSPGSCLGTVQAVVYFYPLQFSFRDGRSKVRFSSRKSIGREQRY